MTLQQQPLDNMSKNVNSVLSDEVVYTKYAKYRPDLERRETWNEIVDRYLDMMVKRYPMLKEEIRENGKFIHNKSILPSCLDI